MNPIVRRSTYFRYDNIRRLTYYVIGGDWTFSEAGNVRRGSVAVGHQLNTRMAVSGRKPAPPQPGGRSISQ